jgi:hypothetical protein
MSPYLSPATASRGTAFPSAARSSSVSGQRVTLEPREVRRPTEVAIASGIAVWVIVPV